METNKEPGVSGKERKGKVWINEEKYEEQKKFMDEVEDSEKGYAVQGHGQSLHGRSDLRNQDVQEGRDVLEDQVLEALKRSPQVDIQNIRLRAEGSVIHLEGLADDVNELRTMENVIMNVPGVSQVVSHVDLRKDEEQI